MASSNNSVNLNNLSVIDLDYDNLKTSLKNFLKDQSQFKDYDYDGPNMATLLRLLSYNTYINAFYTNMAVAEGHLDSAQLRSSVISHAKDLNYLPRSIRSSEAKIRAEFEATGASQPYTIQKGSLFSAVVKNTSYVFSTPETIVVSSTNNTFSFETNLYEGFFVKDSYVFKTAEERFKISNKNVDTRSITVTVYEDGAEIGDTYVLKTTLLDVNNKSKVFFLQATEDGYYEVLFGDNVLGRRPKVNSTIVIDYRISSGPEADGAKLFSMDFDPTSDELNSTPVVTTLESSKNGQVEEPIESIRYYAPRHFQVQERTVIAGDYSTALKTAFPEINVVASYGGEEANPPRMSKVFVSVDLSNVDGLPDSKVDEYTRFLKGRSPYGIDPIFIEPDYLYLFIDSTIRYDVNITTASPQRIKTLVTNAITDYNDVNLNDFESTFRDSAFCRTIDFADVSIISNITDVKMYKKLNVSLGENTDYIVNFNIPIRDTLPNASSSHIVGREIAFTSDAFVFNGQTVTLEDNGNGILRIIKQEGNRHIEVTKIGTINYSTGEIKLNNLRIDSFNGPALRLYAYPKDKDITSNKNTILSIEASGIDIDVEEITKSNN